VALKYTGSDQYTIWNTDTNGNYVSSPIGVVSGTSTSLKSLEPSFYQDLNGDGVIGIPAATSGNPSAQAAAVTVASRDTFVFHPGGGVGIVANAGSEDTIELDGFSSATGNQLAALLQDTQSGQSQALFHSANEGHDIAINLGSRDKVDPMNSHIADLNAGNFIIH
jgi:serralysin